MSRANLDAGAGGQLIKIPQNQVEATIEEVAKNYSWGGRRKPQAKKGGRYELEKVDQLQHQIELLNKGLQKLNAGGNGGSSSSQVNAFSCEICGGTNHDTSYCGGLSPEHINAYNTRQDGPKGSEEVEKEGEDKKGDEEVNVEKEVGDKKSKGKDPIDTRKCENPVPYPGRVAERKLNDKFAKFLDVMKGLHINLPFLEVVTQMPSYEKFLKDILSNKRKLKDEFITLLHQVSALVQHKMPKKQRDPGSFTLPVKIGNLEAK
ncbi:uncharacterized protein LOC110689969 [Chenopodium quinoa]|uniref:uncharacterized protein LOC110689969 n=1 Tax=Chenopodium quinoa TaxID=63459 RepID=UPI000B79294B|nr:uncharacterized protein LOC110689969 [Chenopodium quinoa]